MPGISIIVPIYKVEEYLAACIDSILAQTYKDYELILIDDGSPDGCGEICEEYAERDKRIRVIHQENKGLSGARNTGLNICKGEFISFVDSDDILLEQYLECLYEAVTKSKADVSVCHSAEFDKACPDNRVDLPELDVCVLNGKEAARQVYQRDAFVPVTAWGKLYKRELFTSLRFPEGKIHEDQAVIPLVLYNSEKVAVLKDELYGYRVRSDSIMNTRFSIRRYDGVEAIENCADFFFKNGEYEIFEAARARLKELTAIYMLMAYKEGLVRDVPEKYRMRKYSAIMYLRKNISYESYTYWLGQLSPRMALLEEYIRKLKKILGLPLE